MYFYILPQNLYPRSLFFLPPFLLFALQGPTIIYYYVNLLWD